MLPDLGRATATHPLVTLAALSAITVGLVLAGPDPETAEPEELFAPDDLPERQAQERLNRAFGSTTSVFVVFRTDDPRAPVTARAQADLATSLDRDAEAQGLPSLVEQAAGKPLERLSDEEVTQALDDLRGDPRLGALLAEDAALLILQVEEGSAEEIVDDVDAALEGVRPDYPGTVEPAGPSYVEVEEEDTGARDIQVLLPAALVLIGITLFAAFRRGRDVAAAGAAALVGTAWAYLLLPWLGIPFSPLLFSVAPLLLGLGVDYALHVSFAYRRSGDGEAGGRIREAFGEVGRPVTITVVTTAIGFGSFLLSPIPQVRYWGALMMAGAGGAFVAVGTVLPAVYGLADRAGPSAAPAFGRRLLEAVAGLVTGRPRVPAAALLVLTVLAAASATNVGLAEDVRGGAEPTPARERLERVGERFGSQDQAVVVVDAPARDVREPLHALSVEVAGIDGVSTVDSPTLRAAALSNGSLPEQDRYEDLLRNTSAGNLSADGVTRVDVRYDGDSEGALAALREASDSSSLDAQLAGPGPLQDASRGLLVENLVYSTAGALALILLTLAALHREPRWTAVAFGPLGVVVIWQFGIMGAAGVSLNPVTGVTTAMVLGIGVDYTVHLTERVRSARSGGEGPSAAGRRAVLETGAPILATTATTVAAFGLLGASANPQVAQFGLVAAVVIASAFVVALVLVPLASRWAGSP